MGPQILHIQAIQCRCYMDRDLAGVNTCAPLSSTPMGSAKAMIQVYKSKFNKEYANVNTVIYLQIFYILGTPPSHAT
jgi:hypothetical protein